MTGCFVFCIEGYVAPEILFQHDTCTSFDRQAGILPILKWSWHELGKALSYQGVREAYIEHAPGCLQFTWYLCA